MPKQTTKKPTLSKMLEDLETIIDKMESEELDLEKSLKLFEKGVGLVKDCQKTLSKADQKVQQLTKGKLEDFDTDDE